VRGADRRERSEAVLSWGVPLASIAAFGIGLLASLAGLLAAIYASSDSAIAPYLTEIWLKAPAGSRLLMGHAPFYLGFWIFRFLHLLPDYHLTWELAPWVLSVAASLSVAWATARAAGRAAGLFVAAALICAGTYLLPLQFSWSVHGLTYLNVMLLGSFLVWLARERVPPLRLGTAVLLLTGMTAISVATDRLVIVAGLIPFAVVGFPLTWRCAANHRPQLGTAVTAVTAGSVAGAFAVDAVMRSEGLRATAYPIAVAPLASIPSHLLLLAQSVYSLLNGNLHEAAGAPVAPRGVLGYLCAAAVTVLLTLAAADAGALVRRPDRTRRQSPQGTAEAFGGASLWRVNTAFWCASAAIVSVVYVGTTLPTDIWTRRYLVTVAYGVLVLGISRGARAGRRVQILTAAAVTTILVASVAALFQREIPKLQVSAPSVAMAREVDRLTARERVDVVYGGYWDAYALGWLGARAVRIAPVSRYGDTLIDNVASGSGQAGVIRSRKGPPVRRSMLLLDRRLDPSDGMPGAVPRVLGAPLAHVRLDGGRLNAYVYSYNIATRFHR
jgi:hypothetical protein